jgi:hypothetical protein
MSTLEERLLIGQNPDGMSIVAKPFLLNVHYPHILQPHCLTKVPILQVCVNFILQTRFTQLALRALVSI